eukprot:79142-Chlamydomonas_euryale.AAC.2
MTDRVAEGLKNRGFGFLVFYNHAAAEAARKRLSRPGFRLDPGHDFALTVTWAEPKKADAAQESVRSVYIGNLPAGADEAKLRDVFSAYGKIASVVLLKDPHDAAKLRGYGFVHYEERASALKAVDEVRGRVRIEGSGLGGHWTCVFRVLVCGRVAGIMHCAWHVFVWGEWGGASVHCEGCARARGMRQAAALVL